MNQVQYLDFVRHVEATYSGSYPRNVLTQRSTTAQSTRRRRRTATAVEVEGLDELDARDESAGSEVLPPTLAEYDDDDEPDDEDDE